MTAIMPRVAPELPAVSPRTNNSFGLRDTAGNSGATLGMMAVMLPMFFLAMYQKNGQPAEKILRYYFQARFVRPKVRPYKTRNYYALLMKGDDTHDSVSEKE